MSGQYGIKMVDTERFEAIFEGHWPIGPHPDLGVPYISKRCGRERRMMTISYADGTETVPTNRRSSLCDRHYATGLESTVEIGSFWTAARRGGLPGPLSVQCRGCIPHLFEIWGTQILNLRRRGKMWATRPALRGVLPGATHQLIERALVAVRGHATLRPRPLPAQSNQGKRNRYNFALKQEHSRPPQCISASYSCPNSGRR